MTFFGPIFWPHFLGEMTTKPFPTPQVSQSGPRFMNLNLLRRAYSVWSKGLSLPPPPPQSPIPNNIYGLNRQSDCFNALIMLIVTSQRRIYALNLIPITFPNPTPGGEALSQRRIYAVMIIVISWTWVATQCVYRMKEKADTRSLKYKAYKKETETPAFSATYEANGILYLSTYLYHQTYILLAEVLSLFLTGPPPPLHTYTELSIQ